MYLIKLIDYWQHRLSNKKELRLAMSILVRDEEDVIEDNIRFHAKKGVDFFVVMVNNSVDRTREILESLSAEFEIHIIDQTSNEFKQAEWVTEMAFLAKSYGADWVMNNDADEFWQTQSSYKALLSTSDSVVTVKRYNMALCTNQIVESSDYLTSPLKVKNTINFEKHTQFSDDNLSILLRYLQPNVLVNPYGLIRVGGGNHRANHVWRLQTRRTENKIEVMHYPIRSYQQFKNKVEIQYRQREYLAPLGGHMKRWMRIYEQGGLEQEFERFLLNSSDVDALTKIGVLSKIRPLRDEILLN